MAHQERMIAHDYLYRRSTSIPNTNQSEATGGAQATYRIAENNPPKAHYAKVKPHPMQDPLRRSPLAT